MADLPNIEDRTVFAMAIAYEIVKNFSPAEDENRNSYIRAKTNAFIQVYKAISNGELLPDYFTLIGPKAA